jgi:hypothetical protein
MKAKTNSLLRAAGHSIGAAVCAGAVLLIATCAQAQSLFVSDNSSGNIYEFQPDGTRTTFASGLTYPIGLAFDSANVGTGFLPDSRGDFPVALSSEEA